MEKFALATVMRGSAAAVAMALAAMPAAAQIYVPAGYHGASKSEAILGGTSRLAAILAQQLGQPIPGRSAALPVFRPAVSTNRPDVFGSVALPITRSSLHHRWRRVSHGAVGAAPAAFASSLDERDPVEKLEAVNRYVNARVSFVDDIRQYRAVDHWTSARETLRRGKGDCEDYAIAKLHLLRRAGFADKDLYLVILRDAFRRADHAVLVARAEGRLLVLDNGTDRLIDSYELRDYRPIVTFSGNRAWTHGYRREAPPVVIASSRLPTTAFALAATGLAPIIPSTLR